MELIEGDRGIFDVIVDVRTDSPNYLRWEGVELSDQNQLMLYVPEGFAHGYQTLTGEAEVFYMVSQFYEPSAERGIRWNDPLLRIAWPLSSPILSSKDAGHADLTP